jgi:hypothetical protein
MSMRKIIIAVAAAILNLSMIGMSYSQPRIGQDSMTAFDAFLCWGYLDVINNEAYSFNPAAPTAEQERLYSVGYTAALRFLRNFKQGAIPEDQVAIAVISVMKQLRNQSDQFIIGRIFERAVLTARLFVERQTTQQLGNVAVRKQIAMRRFQHDNCAQIK